MLDVAEHLGFGTVAVEYRVGQESALPFQPGGIRRQVKILYLQCRSGFPQGTGKHGDDVLQVLDRDGLIQGDAHPGIIDVTEIDFRRQGFPAQLVGRTAPGQFELQGVKKLRIVLPAAQAGQGFFQNLGENVNPVGDFGEPVRAVIHRIHTGHIGQEGLGGADVGGGLLPADVLLAGLQRHAEGRISQTIERHSDDPPRHLAFESFPGGEKCRMGPTVTHRHSQTLGGTDHHISPHLSRRFQQSEGQQIGRYRYKCAGRMYAGDQLAVIRCRAVHIRILQQDAVDLLVPGEVVNIDDLQPNPQRFRPGLQHVDGLGQALVRHHKGMCFLLLQLPGAGPVQHGHGLSGGGAFIQQRGVGDLHRGKIADQGLEIQQCFQPPLGHLRLVGGVGGIPAGIFEKVALDDPGDDAAVIAHADVGAEDLVLLRNLLQLPEIAVFVHCRRDIRRIFQANPLRYCFAHQLVERSAADGFEHVLGFSRIGTNVPRREGIRRS